MDDIYCLNLVMRHLGMGTVEIVTACRMAQDIIAGAREINEGDLPSSGAATGASGAACGGASSSAAGGKGGGAINMGGQGKMMSDELKSDQTLL